ncbi:hypothetical protein ACA910_017554 [Epithemia clementina (nom. ined.)]
MSAYKDPCQEVNNITCLPYGTNTSGYDPARIINPFEGINYTGCNEDLLSSDFDADGRVTMKEYETFVADTAARRCIFWPELTLGQKGNYNSLACQCASHQHDAGGENNVNDKSCCIGSNAHLSTAGAPNARTATEPETVFLQNVCLVTYGTLPGTNCSIQLLPFNEPPPVIVPFVADPRSGATAEGSDWNLLAPIIATFLLLLLCCCCCCVVRRRRRKEEQEEEIIETEYPGKEEWLETPLQGQSPNMERGMPVPVGADGNPEGYRDDPDDYDSEGKNRKGGYDDDEYSDGDGRRARGYNHAIPEEEDTKRRWPGGEYVPPENPPNNHALRPTPEKDPMPPPEWDEPMRNIDELKHKDDQSVQEFDPYNPDAGVHDPQRPPRDPVTWKNNWERGVPPEDDENDGRKHRIQSGMGQGEIWDRLDTDSVSKSTAVRGNGDVFDWVVKSALAVMDGADQHGYLDGDDDSTVPGQQS